ncbi:M28 family peptidase [candidate division KSB1 bacterium]
MSINSKVIKKALFLVFIITFFYTPELKSQNMEVIPITIMPDETINDIVNEISGTGAFNHIMELSGYARDRKEEEYKGIYFESRYITEKAKEYGLSDVHIEHFQTDEKQWDAEIGELWLVEPEERLLISYRDVPPCLAKGSRTSDITAEVVYIGETLDYSSYARKDIEGNIILTSGSVRTEYNKANRYGSAGIIGFKQIRNIDYPDQVIWTSVNVSEDNACRFAFTIPPRLGDELKKMINKGMQLKIRAVVKTAYYEADIEVPTALIKGDGTSDKEVVLCAHLFEGIAKQGALDNISGSAAILESGRAITKLIELGKIPRPKRSIRFLWIPEMTGTRLYLRRFPDEVDNMIAAINLDMVGEDVSKNHNALHLYRSVDSRGSFLNDICEEFFEYVGSTNYEEVHNKAWTGMLKPIIDPSGKQYPFYYSIENYFGSSDHIIFLNREFKIPAVMFNNWPDMFYHSNQDRPDKADPTQLKRAVFIALASAYTIANADVEDIPYLLSLTLGKGAIRIMKDLEKGFKYMSVDSPKQIKQKYKEAKYIIHGAYIRELIHIRSFYYLSDGDKDIDKMISLAERNLLGYKEDALVKLTNLYKILYKRSHKKPEEPKLTEKEKDCSLLTPISLNLESRDGKIYSNSYGFSSFSQFELMNYIDSGFSLLDIHSSIFCQFGKVEISNVEKFYKKLEERGKIKLIKK